MSRKTKTGSEPARFVDDDQESVRKLSAGIANLQRAAKNIVMTPVEAIFLETLISRQVERRAFFLARLNERKRAAKMAFAKIERAEQARIDEIHKQSGFTDFIVRAPGSFGSGSK